MVRVGDRAILVSDGDRFNSRLLHVHPKPQVYHMVSELLDVLPASLCMLAAHVWDTIGAQTAEYSATLITRPGNAPLLMPGLLSRMPLP
jgi:2-haloacid dehalogenase